MVKYTTLGKLFCKILEFKKLGKNWDGYNSEPINVRSCQQAIAFLIDLEYDFSRIHVYPTCSGYIGIEFMKSKEDIGVCMIFKGDTIEIL